MAIFNMTNGTDLFTGTAADDDFIFTAANQANAADVISGGPGFDRLLINANVTVNFSAMTATPSLADFEALVFGGGGAGNAGATFAASQLTGAVFAVSVNPLNTGTQTITRSEEHTSELQSQ